MRPAKTPRPPAPDNLPPDGSGLWRWAGFAGLLSVAGLPIYIHAPKHFAEAHGVSLAALGLVLGALRLVDVVQDPALGWLAEATRARRAATVWPALALMAAAMAGLFAIAPPIAPLAWFALTLGLLFSAYSFLVVVFYAEGVTRAATLGKGGHVRLAAWRESGSLAGVCLAAVAPAALALVSGAPLALFALAFAPACLAAGLAMRGQWAGHPAAPAPGLRAAFAPALRDRQARRLLVLALLNGAPVAITSTLFLFFVESRLRLPAWDGAFLLLFFLSAGVSVPFWTWAARRTTAKTALQAGMCLAILSFGLTLTLDGGEALAFAVICIASGAGLGADLTLLPALFARRLGRLGSGESAAFGLWSFASKLSLALAAVGLLPLLDASGFVSGPDNGAEALRRLTLLYAALPCALKLLALALLTATPLEDSTPG